MIRLGDRRTRLRTCVDPQLTDIQYRRSIPSPVDRTSASAWLYKPWTTPKNKPRTSMNNVACKSNKATLSCEIIHASMPMKLFGNRTCGRI